MVADNLGLTLALRFVRSRRKGALTRFISFASTCGIAIGVFAAIVGLSAMNGFERELENRVLSVIPSAQLNSSKASFSDADDIERILLESEQIIATSPAIDQRAIISANRAFAPLMISGIKPQSEAKVSSIQRFIETDLNCLSPEFNQDLSGSCSLSTSSESANTATTESSDNAAQQANNAQASAENEDEQNSISSMAKARASSAGSNAYQDDHANENDELASLPRIVIGSGIAKKLKVGVGDHVSVVTLENSSDDKQDNAQLVKSLKAPDKHKALVIGIVHLGGQLDSSLAMMDFEVLRKLAKLEGANSIHIRTADISNTNTIVFRATSGRIKESVYLITWMNSQGKLYHDIQMVRQIMFVAMFLVLAVACFNIVSNLLMMVGEKRREIAILLTMGMKPVQIVRTFSLMGIITGCYGTLIGLVLGVAVSLLVTPITSSFRDWFGFDLLNEEVYFINFIPCELNILDVIVVMVISLAMSWGAAMYPAYRAARVRPAQELNL